MPSAAYPGRPFGADHFEELIFPNLARVLGDLPAADIVEVRRTVGRRPSRGAASRFGLEVIGAMK
jgi:hypothetical protein